MNIAHIWTVGSWFDRVDNSALVFFRIWFGFLLFAEAAGAIATGWVTETMVEPSFTFSFFGFEWLQPLPGGGMYYYFGFMALLGLGVMLGFYYRISIIGYALLWSGAYLMQKSNYNNHYYMLMLLCWITAMLPANRWASLDVRMRKVSASLVCPRWCVGILLFEVALVYFYAAVAKMEPDWLAVRPVDLWFTRKADYWLIGPILNTDWMKMAVAYGGLFFDLLIVPLLIWKRTRWFAFGLSLFFHLFNSAVFQIGIFPYMMIAFTIMFFPVEYIRKWFFRKRPPVTEILPGKVRPALVVFIIGWFVVQAALPLRHHFIPGEVNWTEEGHRLSWHMMTRSKWAAISFVVKDPVADTAWTVRPSQHLSKEQAKSMPSRPDMIWTFVQRLKQQYHEEGREQVEIYARSRASLNGRLPQALIDPKVDLAQEEWSHFSHHDWILPLEDKWPEKKRED